MLVLNRKLNESFWIRGDIEVKVVRIGLDSVRLSFKCPPDVKIYRSELLEAMREVQDKESRDG